MSYFRQKPPILLFSGTSTVEGAGFKMRYEKFKTIVFDSEPCANHPKSLLHSFFEQ